MWQSAAVGDTACQPELLLRGLRLVELEQRARIFEAEAGISRALPLGLLKRPGGLRYLVLRQQDGSIDAREHGDIGAKLDSGEDVLLGVGYLAAAEQKSTECGEDRSVARREVCRLAQLVEGVVHAVETPEERAHVIVNPGVAWTQAQGFLECLFGAVAVAAGLERLGIIGLDAPFPWIGAAGAAIEVGCGAGVAEAQRTRYGTATQPLCQSLEGVTLQLAVAGGFHQKPYAAVALLDRRGVERGS